jgi:hypothetical protein
MMPPLFESVEVLQGCPNLKILTWIIFSLESVECLSMPHTLAHAQGWGG